MATGFRISGSSDCTVTPGGRASLPSGSGAAMAANMLRPACSSNIIPSPTTKRIARQSISRLRADSGTELGDSPVRENEDWVWREDRIADLLATEDVDLLFLSGCAENMGTFLPQFDQVILLSAPADTIVERLQTRTTNAYGKHP